MTNAIPARKMLNSFVPISRFNKGEAGKIFNEVKRDGIKIVLKNNEPESVILSTAEYNRLQEELEDAQLIAIAMERLANFDGKTFSHEELMAEYGITQADLDAIDDSEIEFD